MSRTRRTTRAPRFIAGMSGAAAAAADLARVRKTEAAEHEEVDPAAIEAGRLFFGACETYIKGLRMYREGHPALERFRGMLDDKLRVQFERHGALEVNLTAIGLDIDEVIVYQADRVEQNIWFALFRDGVRHLMFDDGLDRDELLKFLDVISMLNSTIYNEHVDTAEDDAVTALWDADLKHIRYIVIDTYVESASDQNKAGERIREIVTLGMMKDFAELSQHESTTMARRLAATTMAQLDFEAFTRRGLAALDEVPENLRAIRGDLFTIEASELKALADGLQSEASLFEKFLAGLVQALIESSENAGPVCARIDQLFTGLVKDRRFARAAELRRQVTLGLRIQAFGDATLLGLVDRAMASEAAIAAVVEALVELPDDQLAPVLDLVGVMPDVVATPLFKGLAKVTERPRRRAVCEVAAGWRGAVEAAAAVMRDASSEYTQDLLFLVGRVGGELAVQLLENATRHEAPEVRTDALRFLSEVAQAAVVERRARASLGDDHPDVRAAALGLLVACRSQIGLKAIKEAIEAKTFDDCTFDEKQRMFRAYVELGGEEAARDLVERAGKKNILMKPSVDDERAAAATVLGVIYYEDARAVLEKLAKGKLVRAHLKEACAEALAKLEHAPPPEARAKRTTALPPMASGEAPRPKRPTNAPEARAARTTGAPPVEPRPARTTSAPPPEAGVSFRSASKVQPLPAPDPIQARSPQPMPMPEPTRPRRTAPPPNVPGRPKSPTSPAASVRRPLTRQIKSPTRPPDE